MPFGALALALASVGLYGVVAYSVSRRTREIGIRIALGAGRGEVVSLVARQGLVLVLMGIVCGWVVAALGTRALSAVLYGVASTDVATFLVTAAVLVVAALVANGLPARRAKRIQPMVALRYE